MQTKISTFFNAETAKNPSKVPLSSQNKEDEDNNSISESKALDVQVTYSRRHPKPSNVDSDDGEVCKIDTLETGLQNETRSSSCMKSVSLANVFNKKRSYAQYHLELGQSDFLLHTCNVCGLKYARGDEGDEKVHKVFHKNYNQGIQFKGWRHERVISQPENNTERILLVLDSDPPGQKHKIKEVVKVMERELCLADDWLLHKLCKVYLLISRNRIVGCLVVEPIKTAHRVISNLSSLRSPHDNSTEAPKSVPAISEITNAKSKRSTMTTLQFGDVTFHREVIKNSFSNTAEGTLLDSGAILCEEEAMPAVCGIRAIWVAISHRRRRIATRLLDAARKSFLASYELQPSQCAFSQPTSAGRAFATSYSCTELFLVYKAED